MCAPTEGTFPQRGCISGLADKKRASRRPRGQPRRGRKCTRNLFFALAATCCAIGAQQQTFLGIGKYGKIIFLERWCTSKIRKKSFALFIVRRCGEKCSASHKRQKKNVSGDTRSYQYCQIISTMACHWGNSDEGLRVYVRRREEDRSSNKYGKKSFYVYFLGTRNRSLARTSRRAPSKRRCVCEHTGNPRAKIINNTTLLFFSAAVASAPSQHTQRRKQKS